MNALDLRSIAQIKAAGLVPPYAEDDEIFAAFRNTFYWAGLQLNMALRDFMEPILTPVRKVLHKFCNG
jgi:hypothetical protein